MSFLKFSQLQKTAGATQQQIDSAVKKLNLSSPEELLNLVNAADPTPEKKFESWLIRQLSNKNIRLPEDNARVQQVLSNFIIYSNKRQLKFRDINQYPKIHDLERELEEKSGTEFNEKELLTVERLRKFPGVQVFEGSSYVIAAISNKDSLETLGMGTKWCTRKDYNHGNTYAQKYLSESKTGNVYIVYEDTGDGSLEKIYQFEDTFDQVMDVEDNPVDIDSNLSTDIQDMFNTLNIPNSSSARVFMYLKTGDEDELFNLIYHGSVDGDAVAEYFNQHFSSYSSNEPSETDWRMAVEFGIRNHAFEWYSSYNCPSVSLALIYATNVSEERMDSLEEFLFEDIDTDHYWESLEISDLWDYYKKLVKPEIESSEEEDDYTSEDNWGDLFKKLVEKMYINKDYRITLNMEMSDVLEMLNTFHLSPDFYLSKLEKDSKEYNDFKQKLIQEGYIPELLEHDWGI